MLLLIRCAMSRYLSSAGSGNYYKFVYDDDDDTDNDDDVITPSAAPPGDCNSQHSMPLSAISPVEFEQKYMRHFHYRFRS